MSCIAGIGGGISLLLGNAAGKETPFRSGQWRYWGAEDVHAILGSQYRCRRVLPCIKSPIGGRGIRLDG